MTRSTKTVLLIIFCATFVTRIEAQGQQQNQSPSTVQSATPAAPATSQTSAASSQTPTVGVANTAAASPSREADDYAMRAVENVHGMAGPFAVAGWRMGQRALKEIELLKGSFAVDVSHSSPAEVQWACIADGMQAATGASVGKLNLHYTQVSDPSKTVSTIVNRETGARIVFRLRESFLKKYYNVPFENLTAAGRSVLQLKDEDIFEIEMTGAPSKQDNPFRRRDAQTPAQNQTKP